METNPEIDISFLNQMHTFLNDIKTAHARLFTDVTGSGRLKEQQAQLKRATHTNINKVINTQ